MKSKKVNNNTAEMIALAADLEEGQFCQKLLSTAATNSGVKNELARQSMQEKMHLSCRKANAAQHTTILILT
jgi:hypothetical protein